MATIVKRGKNFYIVFRYDDANGNSQQRWESFKTKKEAQKRKSEVEHEIDTGTFIPPTSIKIKDFLVEFVDMYGRRKWGTSMYASNTGLIRNDINPIIGEINVQDMDARMVDKFIATLQKFKAVDCNGRRAKTEFVTPCTIEKICKLMRCAFGQAIRWGMVGGNPFIGATLPKREQKKRAIWDAETIRSALDACEDDCLYLAIHLAFACSLRFGEICGLTWDCVDISDAAIMNGNAYLKVEKVLARVDEDRKVNAQRFEAGFYARADLRGLEQSFHSQIVQQPGVDIAQLLVQLQQNPQLVTLLNGLLKMNVSG